MRRPYGSAGRLQLLLVAVGCTGCIGLGSGSAAAAAPVAGVQVTPAVATVDSLPTYAGDPILVEAERWRQPWIPMASTVLERADLDRPGILRLAEALRPVVGVRVARHGALGAMMPVSIRGSSNEQFVVLVDGHRLTAGRGGGVDLGRIDPQAIERVEVLRGAASALHGADAINGVVAVTTRPDRQAGGTHLELETGSLGTLAGGLRLAAPLGPETRYWLRGHGLTSRGDYAAHDINRQRSIQRENSRIDARGFAAGIETRPSAATKVLVDGSIGSSTRGVPGPIEFPTPRARRRDQDRAAAVHLELLDQVGHRSRMQFAATLQSLARQYQDPDQGIDDRHDHRVLGGEWQLDLANQRDDSCAFGVAGRRERLDSTSEGFAQRKSGAVFTRLRRQRTNRSGWELTLGTAARLDALSGFAPFVSARAGATLTDPQRRAWRLGVGRAFRAPSFSDLFMRDLGGARGNPDLRPERAFELDGGLTVPLGSRGVLRGGRLQVDLFWNAIDDLIQWVPGADAIWRPHNIGLAIIRGIEFEAAAELMRPGGEGLQIAATASWLDARNRSGEANVNGRRLTYRPYARGSLALDQRLGGHWRVGATWHLTSASQVTAANTKQTPGYGVVDLRAEHLLTASLGLTAAVLNLTAQPATDIRDYPLPGREWRLGCRLASGRSTVEEQP